MAVRPPQGGDSEPDAIEFGIAALGPKLDDADLEFPADAAAVSRALGDARVPYDAAGSVVTVDEVLEAAPRERYESRRELLDELHPVFEAYRTNAQQSLLGRLRSLLPF